MISDVENGLRDILTGYLEKQDLLALTDWIDWCDIGDKINVYSQRIDKFQWHRQTLSPKIEVESTYLS